MGILDTLAEQRAHPSNFEAWLINGARSDESASGVIVDEDGALSSTAVWAAVRLVAETMASVPLHLYRQEGRTREVARDHPTFELLYRSPNPEITSFDLREMLHTNLELSGDAFAEIVWRGGYPAELWPLWSDRMKIERKGGTLRYVYRLPTGQEVVLRPMNVLHVRGFSRGGLSGMSAIDTNRDAIGLNIALQRFAARFFGNDASVGSVLKHPARLSKDARDSLREQIESEHGGLENAHRMMILQEGMEWQERGVSPEQAQALESRKFGVAEVARIFNVPPHLLKDLDRATFNNIEHQSIEFVRYAIRPRAVRWEQRLEKSLLTESDRANLYVRFNLEGLLRGDLKSRYEAYSIGRQNGWLSSNDVRDLEDLNPIEGGGGDDYHVQLNMVPLDMSREVAETDPEPDPEPPSDPPEDDRSEFRALRVASTRKRQEEAHKRILEDVGQRMLNGECRRLRKEIDKHLDLRSQQTLEAWLNDFYRDFPATIANAFRPALRSYAELIAGAVGDEVGGDPTGAPELDTYIQQYAETLGIRWSASSRRQLLKILRETDPDEVREALLARVDQWQEDRAVREARHEANQANNAFAKAAYLALGVTTLRWVTLGDSCPYCQRMNGRTVAIQGFFLDAGQEVEGNDEKPPFTTRQKIGHPPLHNGCDCQVVAG